MRRKFLFVLIAFAGLVSCGSSEETSDGGTISKNPRHLEVEESSINLGYKDNLTSTIHITSDNTGWQITGTPTEWLTVSPLEGRSSTNVNVNAKENTSVDNPRVAILTVGTTDVNEYKFSHDIQVSQLEAKVYITPSETSFSCSAASTSKNITITTNVDWVTECSETWLTITQSSTNNLSINITENLSTTRTATIYLKRKGTQTVTSTITIVQSEANVTADDTQLDFLVAGETKTVSVNAELPWTAYPSDKSWISVSPESGGKGNATLSIAATENASTNERKGFVYIAIGDLKKVSIPIYQYPIMTYLIGDSLSFGSFGETKTATFYTNLKWEVVSCPSWITVNPNKITEAPKPYIENGILFATCEQIITVTATENPNTTSREGEIVIGREGLTGNKSIKVTQAGKSFSDMDAELHFPNTGSSQTVQVSTDGAWSAYASESWITVSPTSGTGNGQLKITTSKNVLNGKASERIGTVYVTVGETQKSIAIVQEGDYMNISCDNLINDSKPKTISLDIVSNNAWNISSESSWITVNPTNGNGNATVNISIADNPSVSERNGRIEMQLKNADYNVVETKSLSITQPGRKLTLNCTELDFYSDGGTSGTIIITTDGKYSITSSDSWITVSQSDNTFTVSVDKNVSQEARTGSVVIALTDLANGETLSRTISVKQMPKYVNVSKEEFDEDENWNF